MLNVSEDQQIDQDSCSALSEDGKAKGESSDVALSQLVRVLQLLGRLLRFILNVVGTYWKSLSRSMMNYY